MYLLLTLVSDLRIIGVISQLLTFDVILFIPLLCHDLATPNMVA
jgi:hypothetical protein